MLILNQEISFWNKMLSELVPLFEVNLYIYIWIKIHKNELGNEFLHWKSHFLHWSIYSYLWLTSELSYYLFWFYKISLIFCPNMYGIYYYLILQKYHNMSDTYRTTEISRNICTFSCGCMNNNFYMTFLF